MLKTLKDLQNITGKTVILRTDYNVPINKQTGAIEDDLRIKSSLPTIQELLEKGAKIIILTHLGRPKGEVNEELRLTKIQQHLSQLLNLPVQKTNDVFGPDTETKISALQPGQILLIENIRFHKGEKENSSELVQQIAQHGDIYINDAFGTAHRNHASTFGITQKLPSYAGKLMEKEITALAPLIKGNIEKPLTMIFGGAKIDTKIGVIENFLDKADYILVGGGLANTFLAAQGLPVGDSLYEADKLELAKSLIDRAQGKIILPIDLITAKEITKDAESEVKTPTNILSDDKILDIGPESAQKFTQIIQNSKTVIWNGPLGLYEFPQFKNGTEQVAKALANSQAKSIIGGGDSADAIKQFGIPENQFSHISTGGGACIEYLAGTPLDAIEALS